MTTAYDGAIAGSQETRDTRPLYSSGEAAALLGIPARTMRRYLTLGRIRGEQNPITGTWQVSREALTAFLHQLEQRAKRQTRPARVLLVGEAEPLTRALDGWSAAQMLQTPSLFDAMIRIRDLVPDLLVLGQALRDSELHELASALACNERTRTIRVVAFTDSASISARQTSSVEVWPRTLEPRQLRARLLTLVGRPVEERAE